MKVPVSICWLRRDLRLNDNAALYHALKSENPVLLLFIFDTEILGRLNGKQDSRVTFIYNTILELQSTLENMGSTLVVKYGQPADIWKNEILRDYLVSGVYSNHDYEPYAVQRDKDIADILRHENINFYTFKDQVIFEKQEILKSDGQPYTVYSPYFKQWLAKLNDFYIKSYPSEMYLEKLLKTAPLPVPSLADIGFAAGILPIPGKFFLKKLQNYEDRRDYPYDDATSRIGIHLRFGTVSIRQAAEAAVALNAHKWLSELAWRDFYMMILWFFPQTQKQSFKPAYDNIKWRNNEQEFEAWCNGQTGYPIVDAGMRQLNQTGFMHNRVRMITASFLTKHLLIDWRWGEAYFAEKLLDYDMAGNIGGWQWACGSGNDAAPYFRVFNPELQAKKFDPQNKYIFQWAPEYKTKKHIQPIVEHAFARERALRVFKQALNTLF